MIDFNKYFIVGTNSDALHDTMNGMVVGELIQCKECSFWDKEPSQTAMSEIHTCRLWRIGTFNVDYCARASKDGWMKAMLKETE